MKDIMNKTLGGLSKAYYWRQFFFGLIIGVTLMAPAILLGKDISEKIMVTLITIFLTLLYPYSRFVYESIIGFIIGDNVLVANAVLMVIIKYATMSACWIFSVFIAPLGLLYLYFYHSKEA